MKINEVKQSDIVCRYKNEYEKLNISMDIIIVNWGKLEILLDNRDYKENVIEFSLCYKTLIKNDFMMVLVEDFECDHISNSDDI